MDLKTMLSDFKFTEVFAADSLLKKIVIATISGPKTYDEVAEITKATYNAVRKQIDRAMEYFLISKDGKNINVAVSPAGERFLQLSYAEFKKAQEEQRKRSERDNELTTQLLKTRKFFDEFCQVKISECVLRGKRSVTVDFMELQNFDTEMASCLIDAADETIKKFNIVCKELCDAAAIEKDYPKQVAVRFNALPDSYLLRICDIRENHIGKMILVRADIKQKSPPKAVVTMTVFECPSCGQEIKVMQVEETKYRQPNKCACGRKGSFRVLEEVSRDEQRMVLSESLETIEESRQPRVMNCILLGDLTDPVYDMKTNPGNKIKVLGVLGVRKLKNSPQQEYVLHVNNLKILEEDYSEVVVTSEDIEQFQAIKDDACLLEDFAQSAYYEIHGHDIVKKALIMQQFGGSKVRLESKTSRANSHIALVGDPSTAKSDLLRLTRRIAPKSRYAVGSSVSKAGLTACVKKDEFIGDYVLEGGVVPLANKGLAIIDELDKASDEDKKGLNEPLENETVTIDKANIHAVLPADTTVLVAANPKHERFDNYKSVSSQIDLPSALFSRFDLIFVMKDLPSDEKDDRIADSILCRYNHVKRNSAAQKYSYDFIRKYIAHAKRNYAPVLSDDATNYLRKSYVKLRGSSSTDGAVRISFSPRQLEGIVRLAQAYAKLRMTNEVWVEHCKQAKALVLYSLQNIGLDPETGKIDIDFISGKSSSNERGQINVLLETLKGMLVASKQRSVAIEDLIVSCEQEGINAEQFVKLFSKLKKDGDIMEPKKGYVAINQ
jgi:replicative DNA helicase Mcm